MITSRSSSQKEYGHHTSIVILSNANKEGGKDGKDTTSSYSSLLSIRNRSPRMLSLVKFNIPTSENENANQRDEESRSSLKSDDQFIEDFLPAEIAKEEKDENFKRFSYYKTKSDRAKLSYSVHQVGKELILEDDVSLMDWISRHGAKVKGNFEKVVSQLCKFICLILYHSQ
ncbi:predicted protein [Chaetoceros tenuissimus]|uniref:Uncharacterized protein n=1 Tax=Chaetoceros tenuissimus TaxID=426638 RepID=A0AAD3CE89_9STRA|nr:predicted protein [Chaetoceros tenuissimus]